MDDPMGPQSLLKGPGFETLGLEITTLEINREKTDQTLRYVLCLRPTTLLRSYLFQLKQYASGKRF
jgi:hypothetical protein